MYVKIIMGIVLVLMETIMVSTYVMDSIGGMLNPIGKKPKTNFHYKKLMYFNGNVLNFCDGFYWASIF